MRTRLHIEQNTWQKYLYHIQKNGVTHTKIKRRKA